MQPSIEAQDHVGARYVVGREEWPPDMRHSGAVSRCLRHIPARYMSLIMGIMCLAIPESAINLSLGIESSMSQHVLTSTSYQFIRCRRVLSGSSSTSSSSFGGRGDLIDVNVDDQPLIEKPLGYTSQAVRSRHSQKS